MFLLFYCEKYFSLSIFLKNQFEKYFLSKYNYYSLIQLFTPYYRIGFKWIYLDLNGLFLLGFGTKIFITKAKKISCHKQVILSMTWRKISFYVIISNNKV